MSDIYKNFLVIIEEINRFNSLVQSKEFLSISREDHWCMLPNPNGMGHIIIGRKAALCFEKISQQTLSEDMDLKFRVSLREIRKAIEWVFTNQVIKNGNRLTDRLASKIITTACNHVRNKKITKKTFFIPCVISDSQGKQKFDLGGVSFYSHEAFFEKFDGKLSAYTQSVASKFLADEKDIILRKRPRVFPAKEREWPLIEINKISKHFEEELRKYYSSYHWIAVIEVSGFDDVVGQRIAEYSVETALNILRLFIGNGQVERFRQSGRRRPEIKQSRMTMNEKGQLEISLSNHGEEALLDENWSTKLFSGKSGDWIRLAGSLIDYLKSGQEIPLIYQRLIDALWWYGDAVSEPFSHVRIIKYSNALEAFLCTSNVDISHQLSVRHAYLCSRNIHLEGVERFDQIKRFYDARSAIVHGRRSPLDSHFDNVSYLGERLASETLLDGLDWTYFLALQNVGMNEKEIGYFFDNELPNFAYGI